MASFNLEEESLANFPRYASKDTYKMTSSTSAPVNNAWPVATETFSAETSAFEALTCADASAMPVELGARAPLAGLAMLRDSLRILSAFAGVKEGRLSRKQSAQMCELMNGWN